MANYYAQGEIGISFDIADGKNRRLAIYLADWSRSSRSKKIEIVDSNGNVIDRRTIADSTGGIYAIWEVKGKFVIWMKDTTNFSTQTEFSAIFLDPVGNSPTPGPAPEPLPITKVVGEDLVTKGNWVGKYGSEAWLVAGGQQNLPQ